MRRIRWTFSWVAILALVAGSGCTVYAPLEITASNQPGAVKSNAAAVEGTSCQAYLFGIIPLGKGNLAREALDSAKAAGGTDTLTDVTVDVRGFVFIPFYGQSCTIVHGVPSA
ncbi:MAG: TRL domain-containing protein [Myxococcota bacterium]